VHQRFQYTVLPSWAVRFRGSDLHTYLVNPTLPYVLLRDGFDVVVVDGWDSFASLAAFALCRVLRKRYVMWAGSTANEPSWRRTVTLPLVRMLVRGSDGYVAYGSRAREYLIGLGASPERIAIAYNTVDIGWYRAKADELRPRRAEIRRELGLGEGPAVLYVGQLIERKGVDDLLDAYQFLLAKRTDAQLLIAGSGPLESRLRATASSRQLRGVIFAGHVAIPDLPRYYLAADCAVLPSHEEVWGLVLNEAAACGLPLVTTDRVGAGPDLVEPGVNGAIVPAASPPELARALDEVLARPEAMGREAQRIVAHMTHIQNAAAIAGVVRSVVTGQWRI
jgi:glycosyltransferase involved in cell wall biosynthesis